VNMTAWIRPAIIAAVISSLVTALGWYVAHLQDVRKETARWRERIADVQTALLAEIRANRHRLSQIDLRTHAELFAERIKAGGAEGRAFTPFVPREVPTFVFDALVAEIHILPTEVIDPIVLYYRQVLSISQLAEDLRSERFENLEADRKLSMYRDYIELLIHAQTLADEAISALKSSLAYEVLNSQVSDQ
jgi:hypothetical protein